MSYSACDFVDDICSALNTDDDKARAFMDPDEDQDYAPDTRAFAGLALDHINALQHFMHAAMAAVGLDSGDYEHPRDAEAAMLDRLARPGETPAEMFARLERMKAGVKA